MITLKQLQDLFPDEAENFFGYLKNKNKGGSNNAKGACFENFFAVYKIASLFNTAIDQETTFLSSQLLCFVDDLIIENEKDRITMHFQLKDVKELSWSQGDYQLVNDFECQAAICSNSGITPQLYLVVSNLETYNKLTDSIATNLKQFTRIIYFEAATSINSLLRLNKEFLAELAKMCAFSSTDKLETLGAILLGAWDSVDKKRITLKQIIDRCLEMNPNYIKGLINAVPTKLNSLLQKIDGFSYAIENGYIKWKYKKLDEGIIPHVIGSFKFELWADEIYTTVSIKTFEDLEPFLTS